MNFILGVILIWMGWWNLDTMYQADNSIWWLNGIAAGFCIGIGVNLIMQGDDW